MKAVLYARVSSKEQQEEGYSLPAQVKIVEDYAEKNDHQITKRFDVAESAKNEGRKLFNEMARYIKEQPGPVLILCEQVDRLLRGNFRDLVVLDELIKEYGTEIYFIRDGFRLHRDSTANEKLNFDVRVMMARNYLNILSDGVKKGMSEKVAQGGYPHVPPIGYTTDTTAHEVVPDLERRKYIPRIFELAVKGASISHITETIYREGLRNRSGKKLARSYIGAMLHDPFFYGNFTWKGSLYKGHHEPLISKELFDQVQETISPRGHGKGSKHNFAFAGGLISCGECASGITAEIQKGHIYYRCSKPAGKVCLQPYIREELLVNQLKMAIEKLKLPDEVRSILKDALKDASKDEIDYRENVLTSLNNRHKMLQERLDKLLEGYLDGTIDKDTYGQKSSLIKAEKATTEESISSNQRADVGYNQEIENIFEISYQAPDLFAKASDPLKRELVANLFSNLSLKDRSLQVEYKLPFNLIVKRIEESRTAEYADVASSKGLSGQEKAKWLL